MAITRPVAGGIITANGWGIPVTDRINALDDTVRKYPTQAALLADTTAPSGCIGIAVDTGTRWFKYGGGAWRPWWPRLVGYGSGSTTTVATATGWVDLPGASVTIPFYAGSRYHIIGDACLQQTGAAAVAYLGLFDGANGQIVSPAHSLNAGEYDDFIINGFSYLPGAATSVKLRIWTQGGTLTSQGGYGLYVIDYGPA